MKKLLYAAVLCCIAIGVKAQDSTKTGKLTISGYAELYYGFDFNKPENHNRPPFVYSHNRTNEVNLNLGFIKANYDNERVRANLAFMAGTYTNANLAAEPGVLKNIYEANAGVKLAKNANLWLDAGVFASHIGFESAVSKDCWVLTRNIASDNTPYFETGAKLSYTTNDGSFTATGLYLNGWQRIQRQDGNNKAAGGLQLTWKPSDDITLNYSNYLGVEGADTVGVRRIYHNLYGVFQLTKQFGITAGFDYGQQEKAKGSSDYNHIVSPVIIGRYQFAEQWAVAGRYEYYHDKNGIFIVTGTPDGFKTSGYSVNIDYAPISNALVRLEYKNYSSKDNVFLKNGATVSNSPLITASIAVSF
ncbi:porin [Mucilaginibacter sp. KACC 22063]|uniref:porin n=1 Tax=Mucilaginibacter sp. KACC 22063 TaxID=3025666 RepID=UPI002365C82B|nr:porin [Mucilaginibacter sp. KACC 22063]WDF54964.1 porin [Mucilaginibacter sp. KACC 22063]